MISKTAKVTAWGSDGWNTRRVTHLTKEEREAVRQGLEVLIEGCPEYKGQTVRRIVEINGHFFARMPKEAEQ